MGNTWYNDIRWKQYKTELTLPNTYHIRALVKFCHFCTQISLTLHGYRLKYLQYWIPNGSYPEGADPGHGPRRNENI